MKNVVISPQEMLCISYYGQLYCSRGQDKDKNVNNIKNNNRNHNRKRIRDSWLNIC